MRKSIRFYLDQGYHIQMEDIMDETFTLFAQSLESKWGFRDGGVLHQLVDYCTTMPLGRSKEITINVIGCARFDQLWDWQYIIGGHNVLIRLVKKYLIPYLNDSGYNITDEDLRIIQISHNPIRLKSLNGKPVNDYGTMDYIFPDGLGISIDMGQWASTVIEMWHEEDKGVNKWDII